MFSFKRNIRIKRLIINLAFFFFFSFAGLFLPAQLRAENVIIFKGSILTEDILNGLLTIPYLEIQVASWGLAYSNDDLLIYEPSFGIVSIYEESLIPTLPDPEDIITLLDGTADSLINILGNELFIIFNTDMGIATTDVLDHFATTVPILPTGDGGSGGGGGGGGGDTTPPNTSITSGPSGTISDNNVEFTYTGSDNITSTGNLVYSYRLDIYDANWSAYTFSTSKSYINLPNDSYTFLVRARDQAGKVDLTPASRSFTVNFIDTDGDGLSDSSEIGIYGTSSDNADTDNDGLDDGAEVEYWGIAWNEDTDGDLLINLLDPDSDNDGLNDGFEVNVLGSNPSVDDGDLDNDADGFTNAEEVQCGSDPVNPSSKCFRGLPWLMLLLNLE